MTMANVDDFERGARPGIRRHWVLFLVRGVVMVILGLLAAATPLIATLVVETSVGWLFLTGGFIGLAASFTTRTAFAVRCCGLLSLLVLTGCEPGILPSQGVVGKGDTT